MLRLMTLMTQRRFFLVSMCAVVPIVISPEGPSSMNAVEDVSPAVVKTSMMAMVVSKHIHQSQLILVILRMAHMHSIEIRF